VKTKDDRGENQAGRDQGLFIRHLEEATEKVCSWPKWKQRLLGVPIHEKGCSGSSTKR
jgi:hypothetical protein